MLSLSQGGLPGHFETAALASGAPYTLPGFTSLPRHLSEGCIMPLLVLFIIRGLSPAGRMLAP